MDKRDDEWMHELEFCFVELVELIEEIASLKLEDNEVVEDDGIAVTTIPSDAVPVPTLHSFTHEQRRQAFGPTTSQGFENIISDIGFSPLQYQNSSPIQEDRYLLVFSPVLSPQPLCLYFW